MKKFKGHFSSPSTRPPVPPHQTRPFGPRRKGYHWTPEGHCGCLVDWLHWKCLKPISLASLGTLLASLRSAAGSMIFQKHTYIG